MTIEEAEKTILDGRIVEFSYHGSSYLIQQENNKGYNYLSIWRIVPDYVCLARAFFDLADGIEEATVWELISRTCIENKSAVELLTQEETEHE